MMPTEVVAMKYTIDGRFLWIRNTMELIREAEEAEKLKELEDEARNM